MSIVPGWLWVPSLINPLSYEVDALGGLLINSHAQIALDFGVLAFAVVVGASTSSALVGRLGRQLLTPPTMLTTGPRRTSGLRIPTLGQ